VVHRLCISTAFSRFHLLFALVYPSLPFTLTASLATSPHSITCSFYDHIIISPSTLLNKLFQCFLPFLLTSYILIAFQQLIVQVPHKSPYFQMAPNRPVKSRGKPAPEPSRRVQTHAIARQNRIDSKKMKPILKGLVISLSGDLGPRWEHDAVARWIREHGGIYTKEVTPETTHLITSIEDFKKKSSQGPSDSKVGVSHRC